MADTKRLTKKMNMGSLWLSKFQHEVFVSDDSQRDDGEFGESGFLQVQDRKKLQFLQDELAELESKLKYVQDSFPDGSECRKYELNSLVDELIHQIKMNLKEAVNMMGNRNTNEYYRERANVVKFLFRTYVRI